MVRPRSFVLWAAVLSSLTLASAPARAQTEKTFDGEVADSQCAMNVHSLSRSHREMIEMGKAGNTPSDCTHYCVTHRGGRYVLQVKNDVYKLDRQDLAENMAGLKVRITGTLDPKTNTIQVRAIEPMPLK
jgi:Protein of unknown function (DUF5818)